MEFAIYLTVRYIFGAICALRHKNIAESLASESFTDFIMKLIAGRSFLLFEGGMKMNTCVKGSKLRRAEELFIIFLLTSFAGWLYEVFLEVVVYRWGYSDRGVLTGPYCPVYGVGAAVLLLCLYPLKKRKIAIGIFPITPILVFVGIVAISTAVELVVSYITEWITGGWM